MSFKIVEISYVYALPEVWDKYEQAIQVCGWQKATILTQIAQTYAKVNLEYYQKAVELDAKARGMKGHTGKHFDLLANWQDLPEYIEGRPSYGESPIYSIPRPPSGLERKSFGRFRCSARSSALLNMAMQIEQTNINILMTRLMQWYYAKYWALYLPQIEAAKQHTLSPIEK